jgi:hypothetical protein
MDSFRQEMCILSYMPHLFVSSRCHFVPRLERFGHKGLLAALAASSASCATCEPLGACFVAIGAACFSVLASRWLSMVR